MTDVTTEKGERLSVEEALIEAGFLDAYLNIGGVRNEAEAWRMLLRDLGSLRAEGYVVAALDTGVDLDVERLARAIESLAHGRCCWEPTQDAADIAAAYREKP